MRWRRRLAVARQRGWDRLAGVGYWVHCRAALRRNRAWREATGRPYLR